MELKSKSGVYRIVAPSGRCYIGSAQNVRARRCVHLCDLRKGTHHCHALQKAFDKYGESKLKFEILVYCSVSTLRKREQKFINQLLPEYNSTKVVDNPSLSPRARKLAREHMLRLNQLPWTKERRIRAKERLAKCQPWKFNKPWTKARKKAQSIRMKLRHATGNGPWNVWMEKNK